MDRPAPLETSDITISGAPEGADARIVADLVARAAGPVLVILRDDVRVASMRSALGVTAPSVPVLSFPAWDCLPYDRVSPNAEIVAERMAVLSTLAGGWDAPSVVLTTISAAGQFLPPRDAVSAAAFTANVGERVDVDALRGYLVRMGYAQTPTVSEHGEFAVRGGIIDIFPPGRGLPVRLDLFGDVLDGAREFDPQDQRTIRKVSGIALAAASEVILDEASVARFRQTYRATFGAGGAEDPLYEAISAGRKHQGMEHWLGFFLEREETIFDYLPGAPVIFDDRAENAWTGRAEVVAEQYDARQHAMGERSALATVYKPAPPETLYLDETRWTGAVKGRAVRRLSVAPQPVGLNVLDAGGRAGRSFLPERQQESLSLFGAVADHIKARRATSNVVVAAYSEGSAERFGTLLDDAGLVDAQHLSALSDLPQATGGLYLLVWPLDEGFEVKDLTVITEQDVLGDRLIRPAKRRKRAENYLTEAGTLTPGDLVVHIEHGVGRYNGLETITAAGAPHECLALEYAENAKLYLPVENIELLSRYGHEEGLLDRLGGGAWQAKKAKLKERIREMAEKLIRLAAERALRKGVVMTPPEDMWDQFLARFPYQETDDQLGAIADVLEDMESGRPMDRLVCGDVGFGKTEVALRAAFVAAMTGTQVAVIAPTTLLARQHAKGFADRFRGLPVTVRQLSRFVSAKQAEETREGLAKGTVDIVIGTHALLAKNIKFANLGLLIIDEEQHFGVAHKERLKNLRSDVHVLTMTATPIPRTLQMALSGVRELSLIGTPPIDRLAIRTYVSTFDPVTVREALLREHYRGGQSFFVVPRIADIPEMEEFLREQVPEVSVVVGHGQMAAGELDARMNAFYDGKYDVLLATTIVESGLDIPTANTLIVHRADMFGLAQLYQIRGRVGRSKIRAYAYFMTEARKPLTPQAERRLKVLASLDTLGAGFTLASQDLDIRGAGNLLGEEQSGHVREVGYELYQEMLEEAIGRLKAGDMDALPEAGETWAPQINLGVAVLIPEDYVPDLDVRLGPLSAAIGADREGGAGRICCGAYRPVWKITKGNQHAAGRRSDQGDVQEGRDRAA